MSYRDSMLVLSTVRCSNRCTFCAYHNDVEHITKNIPSTDDMTKQTEEFIQEKQGAIEKNKELYIVNSGSFFSPQIRKDYMHWLSDLLKDKDWGLVVDCRADSKLEKYSQEIADLVDAAQTLTISLGLEVADNEILKILNKGCTLEQYVRQAQKIKSYGAKTKAYILINPPLFDYSKDEGYRENIDKAIERAFQTAKFSIDYMDAGRIGLSPFFPYKGLLIPDNWFPISATESAEVANQMRQAFPGIKIDYTSRQIHFAFGNFFKIKNKEKPIDAKDREQVLRGREHVAEICKKVLGKRGKISKSFGKR